MTSFSLIQASLSPYLNNYMLKYKWKFNRINKKHIVFRETCIFYSDKIRSRVCTKINDRQRSILKQSFESEPYPKKKTYKQLSEQLGLSEKKVYNWFRTVRGQSTKRKKMLLPKCKFMCVSVFCACLCVELMEVIDHISLQYYTRMSDWQRWPKVLCQLPINI